MKKIYYAIKVKNVSPIHIGNGDSTFTDLDLIKDKKGNFYIPGTSLAGPIMHYLSARGITEYAPTIKVAKEEQHKQSPIYISDAILEDKNAALVETRTGIRLENKVTVDGAKYDYEILPEGHEFCFTLEIVDRTETFNYAAPIEEALSAIDNGDILFGYKTTRGFGRLKCVEVKKAVFDSKNVEELFDFNYRNFDSKQYHSIDLVDIESISTTITASLKQVGGISIRTYYTTKGEADYRHIHSNNKPIIPGTSWNGLIRSEISKYNKELDMNLDIGDLFGYVDVKTGDKTKSKIYISESILDDTGYDVSQTRIRVNSFYGGASEGALFKGEYHYYSGTELTIKLSTGIPADQEKKIISLVLLFLKNLDMGYIAIGGETSIGKGLFEVGDITINGKVVDESKYLEVKDNVER